jgi:uncharacterized FlaG/YvyC family protein
MAISGADAPRPVSLETRVTAPGSARAAGRERNEGRQEAEKPRARPPEEPPPRADVRLPEITRHDILFRYDRELNRVIVEVVHPETRAVIRTIPAEEIVQALKVMRRAQGALLDEEA